MAGLWLQDIESLEKISQDARARVLFLRMAELQRAGRTSTFLVELAADPGIDESVKGSLAAIAKDEAFLLALEDYLHRTRRFH